MDRFENRADAGRRLAAALTARPIANPVVLALPRGGVPVGYEIAQALQAPLEVLLVRKIGAPQYRELAIGAVADGDPPHVTLDHELVALLNVPEGYIAAEQRRQIAEIERRRSTYGTAVNARLPQGCTAIVVDDGIATGATMRVALQALRQRQPARVVLAVPVATPAAIAALRDEVDDVVCLISTEHFAGVGSFYADFTQVDDSIVIDLLRRAAAALR